MNICEGKKTYHTFSKARQAAKYMVRKLHDTIVPYQCRHCGRYHIGNKMVNVDRKEYLPR